MKTVNYFFTIILLILAMLTSCDTGRSGSPDSIPLNGPTFEPDTSHKSPLKIFDEIFAQRASRGDTVSLNHTKLTAVLPNKLSTYQLEFDEGNTFHTDDFSFSEGSHVFYKDEEGEEYVEFHIADYSSDRAFMRNLVQRYNFADGVEIEGVMEKRLAPIDKKIFAWTHFDKVRSMARLEAGIDHRIHVKIEANSQSGTEFILQCWKMIEWKSLIKAK